MNKATQKHTHTHVIEGALLDDFLMTYNYCQDPPEFQRGAFRWFLKSSKKSTVVPINEIIVPTQPKTPPLRWIIGLLQVKKKQTNFCRSSQHQTIRKPRVSYRLRKRAGKRACCVSIQSIPFQMLRANIINYIGWCSGELKVECYRAAHNLPNVVIFQLNFVLFHQLIKLT